MGSPWGHKSCQQTCFRVGSSLHGVVHKSFQKPSPAQVRHRVTASFRHPPAPAWGPPHAAGGDSLHYRPPRAAGAEPASPWSGSMGCRGILFSDTWSTASPCFCTDPGVCRAVALTCSQSSHRLQLRRVFSPPFLTMLPQRHDHHC